MIRKFLWMLFIAVFVFVSADSEAGKYKSSSSKSSFSNRSSGGSSFSSKPKTSDTTRKWGSSSSNNRQSASASNTYQQQQQRQAAQQAYQKRERDIAETQRQRALAESAALRAKQQSSSSGSSSYASTQKSSTYSSPSQKVPSDTYRSTSGGQYRQPAQHTTTIIRERDGVDVGDVLLGAAAMSLLSNNATAAPVTVNVNQQPVTGKPGFEQGAAPVGPNVTKLATVRDMSSLPTVRMCTGAQNQQYYAYGQALGALATKYNLEVVPTSGSIQNITMLNSQCDVAIVQRDALIANQPSAMRVASPYADVAMFVCSAESGIVKLDQIKQSTTIAVPSTLSGSYITFNKLMGNKQYTPVKSGNLTEQLLAIRTGTAHCTFAVGTPTSEAFNIIKGTKVVALDVHAEQFQTKVDTTGTPVYFDHILKSSAKFPIQGQYTLMGYRVAGRDADTIAVPNDVVIASKLSDNNPTLASALIADIDELSKNQ